MKTIVMSIVVMLSLILHTAVQGQEVKKDSLVQFWVDGVCDMCKERIEGAFARKGVYSASWNIDSHLLTLHIDPTQLRIDKLHQWAAAAGHDTKLRSANNSTYFSLPDCCLYRGKAAVMHPEKASNLNGIDTANQSLVGLVRGIVLEIDKKGNINPLQGASIQWVGTQEARLSNESGTFSIPLVEGHPKLMVSYAGFRSDTISVEQEQDLKIILASGKELKVVEVTARQRSAYVSATNVVRTQIMTERELFKAACCNLSESFETNPSVDVAYNDAVTGSKQIQMLGLGGSYTQLTVENMPGPRGLATAQGLNYIPGPWISSIQLNKGVGSVANGFESIAGQINVEMKKPEKGDRLFANMYVNDMGKTDLNFDLSRHINEHWSTILLLHHNFLRDGHLDENGDGFKDVPTGNLTTLANRWHYQNPNGWMVQVGFKMLVDYKVGGMLHFNPSKDRNSDRVYGIRMQTDRYEVFSKIGYVFPQKKFKSIGWQLSMTDHDQASYYGKRMYDGTQRGLYSNLIYQSIIGNTNHKFRTGLSLNSDDYKETLETVLLNRRENTLGAFFEYTYSYLDKLNVVAGSRYDYHNRFGAFVTPRLHIRYEPVKGSIVRLAAGRGQRTALIFSENAGVFASSRQIIWNPSNNGNPYGLDPEVAWNTGITFDQQFKLLNRNAQLSIDYFYTDFQKQVVVDWEDPRKLQFYNLVGRSYSSSLQASLDLELIKKLELRMAWRLYDVKTQYRSGLLQKPMNARVRAFTNLAYEWSGWKWDLTYSWVGTKRLPSTSSNSPLYQRATRAPSFGLWNGQVSKTFTKQKSWELYLGVENAGNYMQPNPIIAADNPMGPYFDASQIWGPIYGRMYYGGVRFRIK